MWYKGTEQGCIDYDVKVTKEEGYFKGDNWANPININGNWYIAKHKDYACELELVEELPQQDII